MTVPRSGFFLLSLTLALTLSLAPRLVLHVPASGRAEASPKEIVRVGLVVGRSEAQVGSTGGVLITGPDGAPRRYPAGQLVFQASSGSAITFSDGTSANGPLLLRPDPGGGAAISRLTVGGCSYRGDLEIFARGGLVTVVNVVPLEDYLLGVVPREMPPDFPLEALKAQAVTARTYALYTRGAGAYRPQGFDLLPTSSSQVYGGIPAERERSTAAVRATTGQVLTYKGKPVGAFYHSTSGGHTENPEFVWGFARAYLKGVPDYDQDSPHYAWTAVFTLEELTGRLSAAGFGVGQVQAVEPVGPAGPGGRHLERRILGREGEAVLSSEKMRFILGLKSALFEVHPLGHPVGAVVDPITLEAPLTVVGAARSLTLEAGDSLWTVGARSSIAPPGEAAGVAPLRADGLETWAVSRPVSEVTALVFTGRGWGHGVGLSQWGARGLAQRGWNYREILTHYYTGVAVGTLP